MKYDVGNVVSDAHSIKNRGSIWRSSYMLRMTGMMNRIVLR